MAHRSSSQNSIVLLGKVIHYDLRPSKRSTTIRLTITPEKGLVVLKGKRVSVAATEKFITEKAEWILKSIEHMQSLPQDPTKKFTAAQVKEYKVAALLLAEKRLAYFNQFYGHTYARVSVRDQKTRWGSCSPQRNLQFNYRIALLPEDLSDYIIVHELCHLKQMNHSARFWALVAKTIPDHALRRKALRTFPLRRP